ncbi:MAG: anion permease [Bacteroidetes bacterium]|nr:anion permease [Bacteroidota bacterium]
MINWLYISTGLFLGWSLGANHAVNVFGTAVASRMVRFRTAALVAGVFVILGAVLSGAGTTRTLNTLGSVNAMAGCFTVALAVGLTVTWMTRLKLPVSASQAVVGGIVGWNLFTGSPTDTLSLSQIVSAWVLGPALAALFALLLFRALTFTLRRAKLHMMHLDAYTRIGLIGVGALAAYMLGANSIANVMGMFVSAYPLSELPVAGIMTISGTQQLFLIGGFSIAAGMYTYGERVLATVGKDLYKSTPLSGLVVILAETLVLFLFTSESLEGILLRLGLPTIPLVPLASTQVVIGAVIGVGLAKGGRGINYGVLLKIASGWITAPIAAGLLAFILLFFVQNVFEQRVVKQMEFTVDRDVLEELQHRGVDTRALTPLLGARYDGSSRFRESLEQRRQWTEAELLTVFAAAEVDSLRVDSLVVRQSLDTALTSPSQRRALYAMHGRIFAHRWQLDRALAVADSAWRVPQGPGADAAARNLVGLRKELYGLLRVK